MKCQMNGCNNETDEMFCDSCQRMYEDMHTMDIELNHMQKDAIRDRKEYKPSLSNTKKIVSDGGSTAYYELPKTATEIQDLIEHKSMNFSIGNIFKACYRMGEKSTHDAEYDLNKIIYFAERELKRIVKG